MRIYKTHIKDLLVIKQKNNIDKRGSLRETYNKKIPEYISIFRVGNRHRADAFDAMLAKSTSNAIRPICWGAKGGRPSLPPGLYQ